MSKGPFTPAPGRRGQASIMPPGVPGAQAGFTLPSSAAWEPGSGVSCACVTRAVAFPDQRRQAWDGGCADGEWDTGG